MNGKGENEEKKRTFGSPSTTPDDLPRMYSRYSLQKERRVFLNSMKNEDIQMGYK